MLMSIIICQHTILNFQTKWKSYYSWQRYDEDKYFMYYVACSDDKKRNGIVKVAQNRNFRRSTLERHSSLPDHKAAIQAPSLQKPPLFLKEKLSLFATNK